MGKPLGVAILDGAHQIALPALVGTLCICIVFSPVLRLNGIQEVARSIRVPSTNKIGAFSVHEHRRIDGLSAFVRLAL